MWGVNRISIQGWNWAINFVLFVLSSCSEYSTGNKLDPGSNVLNGKLDYVNSLNVEALNIKNTDFVDSVFLKQKKLNFALNPKNFEELKNALRLGTIDPKLAKVIFPELWFNPSLKMQNVSNDFLDIGFHSFDTKKSDFKYFAVSIGRNQDSYRDVYFFHESTILARHRVSCEYQFDIHHYQDQAKKKVVYYTVNIGRGTGYSWNQWNFYRYDHDGFKPLLSEISNFYCQFNSRRVCIIKGKVASTNPLKIHYVVANNLVSEDDLEFSFLKDSAMVEFKMNVIDQRLHPIYSDGIVFSNIRVPQNSDPYEIAFIKANYRRLKEILILPNGLNQLLLRYYMVHAGVLR